MVLAGANPALSDDGSLDGKYLCRATAFTYLDGQHHRHEVKDPHQIGSEPFLIWLKESGIFQSVGEKWRPIYSITQRNRVGKPAVVGLTNKDNAHDWFRLSEIRAGKFRFANGFVGAGWAEGRPVTMITGTCQTR